jgi:hypothetical protein
MILENIFAKSSFVIIISPYISFACILCEIKFIIGNLSLIFYPTEPFPLVDNINFSKLKGKHAS